MICDTGFAIVIAGDFSGAEENAAPDILVKYLPSELTERCHFVEWSTQPSIHYSMAMAMEMAGMLEKLVLTDGYSGVIVILGSAVMEEIAYLTDLLWSHEQPVIFANLMICGRGGQEEGLINMGCSVRAMLSQESHGKGVMVCSSGELFAASEVVMVAPTEPENTFQAPEKGSLGKVINDKIVFHRSPRRPEPLARRPQRAAAVEVLWTTMGGGEKIISLLSGCDDIDGLVLAAAGTGSVPATWMPHIRSALRRRTPVVVASRCFQGQVMDTNSFEGSFNKLMEIGAISGGKLNPYQARIRMSLGIAAGLTEEGLRLYMQNNPAVSENSPAIFK